MLKVTHNSGFFSCCSVRLQEIIDFLNNNRQLPEIVDSSVQFHQYKNNKYDYDNKNEVTFEFFNHYDNIDIPITYNKFIPIDRMCFQFDDYKNKVDYPSIIPFIKKYFSPSSNIQTILNELIKKYNISTDDCIAIYYRGTDKIIETIVGTYDSYYEKLKEVIENKPHLQILIQTDTTPFLDFMLEKLKDDSKFNGNIIVINENSTSSTDIGIHNEKTRSENFEDIKYLFATFLIISRCKYIICSSGNCSIWMMFFRGNANNVYQNLNTSWI